MQYRSEKNAGQMMTQMDECLEKEEFLAFIAFCEENYIDTYETVFEAYAPAERASRTYRYVYEDIMKLACPTTYQNMDIVIESLSDNLDYFYRAIDMKEYEYYDNIDVDKNEKALMAMEDKTELLLQTYCNLTPEEAAAMKTMSKAKRSVTIEAASYYKVYEDAEDGTQMLKYREKMEAAETEMGELDFLSDKICEKLEIK